MSADGSVVAIGAYLNDGGGTNSGHVRLYGNGTWTQIGSDIDGEFSGDYSGWSVSLSSDGSVVAIGAPKTMAVVVILVMCVFITTLAVQPYLLLL